MITQFINKHFEAFENELKHLHFQIDSENWMITVSESQILKELD